MKVDNPYATEGDTVTSTGTADEANLTPGITWYRGDVDITNCFVHILGGEAYVSIGRISVLTLRQDNGVNYRCEVERTNIKKDHVMDVG